MTIKVKCDIIEPKTLWSHMKLKMSLDFFSKLIRIQVCITWKKYKKWVSKWSFFTVSKLHVSNPDLHTSKPCSKARAVVKTFLRKYLTRQAHKLSSIGCPCPLQIRYCCPKSTKRTFFLIKNIRKLFIQTDAEKLVNLLLLFWRTMRAAR